MRFRFEMLVLFLVTGVECGCPSRGHNNLCTCEEDSEDMLEITCQGLHSDDEMATALSYFWHVKNIHSFTILNSAFNYMSSDAFASIQVTKLEINNSTLRSLTDAERALVGLEDTLENLEIFNSSYFSPLEWSALKNLKKLRWFLFWHGDLEFVDKIEKDEMPQIEFVSLTNNKIGSVHPEAFANCAKLRVLRLDDNQVSQMKRSMFYEPVSLLQGLILPNNKIRSLPEDMFSGMPHLAIVDISYNHITVLQEAVFAPIWDQLSKFKAEGVEISCDCRLSWILKRAAPKEVAAECYQPPHVKGKQVGDLSPKDLYCFHGPEKYTLTAEEVYLNY